MTSEPAGTAQGRTYQVLETLGHGGFGTVYRAELRGAGGFTKHVALKVLNPDVVSPDITRRLRDEARILGLLRHRAIVHVDGLVNLSGRWAVVMEYVQGVDLGRVQRSRGRVPIGAALEIVGEVASALASAWSAEGPEGRPLALLHRDIKPSNIRLTRSGEVKVLDFGIARADFAGREASTTSTAYGSMPYMAPERFEAVDTHAGDVYALGITLTELITGDLWQRPDLSEPGHEVRLQRTCASVRARTKDVGKAPVDELCVLIRDVLAFDHAQRPTAEEVHRRCVRLGRAFGEPLLAEFAGAVVPALLTEGPSEPGELSGSLLIERDTGGALTVARPTPTPAPARASATRGLPLLAGALLAGGGVLVAAVVVAVAAWTLASREPAPEPPVVVAPAPRVEPPLPVPAPVPVAAPAPSPAPEPPPKPAPHPKPAPRVEVALTGASSAALVVGGVPKALPGSFAPGTYDVQADFGSGLAAAGKVTLPASGAATVSCDPGFRLCRVVP